MKNSVKVLAIAFIILTASGVGLVSSCKKSDSSATASDTVSTDDAVDAISSATSASSNGVAEEATASSTYNAAEGAYTTSSSFPCGTAFDTSFTRAYTGSAGTYSYVVNWQYLLTCTGAGAPSSLALGYSMHGAYNFARISSNDSGSASLVFTGLQASSAAVTLNGTYIRNGSEQSKVRNMSSFTSVITMVLTNVTVSKSTEQITGGSAAVTITGASSTGISFAYSGSITFNGGGTATLVINGSSYAITL